jgi:phage tail-like protein
VTFDGGGGLGAIRSFTKQRGEPLLVTNPNGNNVGIGTALFTHGVPAGPTAGWSDWYDQVTAFGATCATMSGEDCDTAWLASGLAKSGTISAIASDGETLATWHFHDAWPAHFSADPPPPGGSVGTVVRLTLSATVDQFAFGSGPAVQALFDGTSPPAAVLPTDPMDNAGLELFMLRYHSLEDALSRLNGLGAVADAATTGIPLSPPRAQQPRYAEEAGSWVVEVDGQPVAAFKKLSGLENEVEVIEYRNGDDPITHKRAGKAKYKNIVLKRGFVNDGSLLEWYKKVLSGQTERKSGSIVYLDREGNEVLRFNVEDAQPIRWKAPELNANSDTYIVEELEFAVERVERG